MVRRFPRYGFPAVPVVLFALGFAGCGDTNVRKAESVAPLAGAAGGPGFFDGSPSDPVRFDSPSGVAVTTTGDRFVADTNNHVIRKIDPSGNVTTLAGKFGTPGSADDPMGTGGTARFDSPRGIVAVGTLLFVCDTGNNTIRRIVSTSGAVTTLAGNAGLPPGSVDNVTGTNARFNGPRGIAFGGANTLFVADTGNHKIRRVFFSGATDTIAGSGTPGFADNTAGLSATFRFPEGVAFDGATLFVADTGNHSIRRITPATVGGDVATLAGDGQPGFLDNTSGLSARFSSPRSMVLVGSDLFVADTGNHAIRRVDTTNFGFVTTLAGALPAPPDFLPVPGIADGTGASARFRGPAGLGIQEGITSLFYVADTDNHTVRQATLTGAVTTVAGNPPRFGAADGAGAAAGFDGPSGIAVIGDDVYLADTNNHTIRKITNAGVVTTLAGIAGEPGSTDSPSRFRFPRGIAALGGNLYVCDTENHTIRKVTTAGVVTPLAGSPGSFGFDDGTGSAARFNAPRGIVAAGGDLYVADTGNHTVRKVTTAGVVTTPAGTPGSSGSDDGTGSAARFNDPRGIAFLGSNLYVADTGNHTVRKVAIPSGATITFAGSKEVPGFADGSGSDARFSSPEGIAAVDSVLYVADRGNHAVRRISTLARVTTFAGDPGGATTRNGLPSDALMNAPVGIAGVPGILYFTDVNENVIRKILF